MKHENMDNILVISAADMQIFANNRENPKYPGLFYDSATDSGDFDSEKGAMTDYLIYLRDKETGEIIWEGEGGYYTGCTGEKHNYELEFTRYQESDIVDSSKQLAKDILKFCKNESDDSRVNRISTMILDWYNKQ